MNSLTDKDALWLVRSFGLNLTNIRITTDHERKRLLAIAKRLQKEHDEKNKSEA